MTKQTSSIMRRHLSTSTNPDTSSSSSSSSSTPSNDIVATTMLPPSETKPPTTATWATVHENFRRWVHRMLCCCSCCYDVDDSVVDSSSDYYYFNNNITIRLDLIDAETKARILANAQKTFGDQVTVLGFISSVIYSSVANPGVIQPIWSGYKSLYDYLQASDIITEINEVKNFRYNDNLVILWRIQQKALGGRDRRDDFISSDMTLSTLQRTFPMEEATRYSKYAIATYGDAVIAATEIDVSGDVDVRLGGLWTKERISKHIGIPSSDLLIVDAEYHGDARMLRHFLAVDHVHKKVVLAIRGTFSNHEITIDVVGYSRPFYDGEAHAGIAIMTERLWEHVGDKVLETLENNDGYEFIVTGHSLGGGATLLLNMILHNDERFIGRPFRAFAYASPPVFALLSSVTHQATFETAVNYIHEFDEVPFLSGDSVRHQVAAIRQVDETTRTMSFVGRARLILGIDDPSDDFVEEVVEAIHRPLPERDGVPRSMGIPAMTNVWIREVEDTGTYDVKLCDSTRLLESGIFLPPRAPFDHYPTRYEHCLMRLQVKDLLQ